METIEVNDSLYDSIQGSNDLEVIDNVSKQAKRRATKLQKKATKTTGKKAIRLTKKAKRLSTKGTLLGQVAKGAGKVAKKIGKTAIQPALLPLIPLKPVMKKALEKKGKKAPQKMLDLVNAFYNEIVKQSNYDYYENIDLLDIPEGTDYAAVAISTVVSAVLGFIKSLKKKKAEGGALTPLEDTILKGTEQTEEKIREEAKSEAAQTVGEKILFDKKTQMYIIIGIVAIVGIALYIQRKK